MLEILLSTQNDKSCQFEIILRPNPVFNVMLFNIPSVKTLGFLIKILDFPTKYLLIFLIRSWKIFLLSEKLEIPNKKSRNIQDCYQEFQEFLHCMLHIFASICSPPLSDFIFSGIPFKLKLFDEKLSVLFSPMFYRLSPFGSPFPKSNYRI